MSVDIHTVLARAGAVVILVLGVGMYFAVTKYARGYEAPEGSDVFAIAEGTWAWSTSDSACAGPTHRISFSPDRRVMTITSSRPYRGSSGQLDSAAVYDILEATPSHIRGAIRGEQRLTPSGEPVVWDLVLRSPTRYAWHRTDWDWWGYTAPIQRCLNYELRPIGRPNTR